MICKCDEERGLKFLPHQLACGVELETQTRIAVTAGFQKNLCEACRGLPLTPHPVAEIYGRTSKIQRYYWRELAFLTMERFDLWSQSHDASTKTTAEITSKRKEIRREVLNDLKVLHATAPKYQYSEESPVEVIKKYGVEVVELKATYINNPPSKGEIISDRGGSCSAEEFASRYFHDQGFNALFLESTPFHVLFGIYMWLIVQDLSDPRVRIVSFGDRNDFDMRVPGKMVWTHLPEDFGKPGYAKRRVDEIERHLSSSELFEPGQLQWLFEYWLGPSEGLRQYLWAHRKESVEAARKLIDILPAAAIVEILRYLVDDYWGHYLGWPDFLVYRSNEFYFAEVKSSADRLSEKQMNWIRDNSERLKFPFKLIKIHKAATVKL